MSEVKVDGAKIQIKNAKVIFAALEDEGFGRSIVIDATEKELQAAITDWVKANKIGKTNPGVANFKDYEGTIQYNFRLNDNTKIVYRSGVSEGSLGYGAVISLSANSFEYNNKFGKGTSASLSAVVVEKGRSTGADADIAELLEVDEAAVVDTMGGGDKIELDSSIPF